MYWRPLLLALLLLPAAVLADAPGARSLQEVLATLDQYPVNEGKRDAAMQVLASPLPTAGGEELVQAWLRRAWAAHDLGLAQTRIDALRAAIALGGGANPARVWKDLSSAEVDGGNFRRAIAARLEAIALAPANRQGQLISDYAALADMYRRIGEFDKAREAIRHTEGVLVNLKRSRGWGEFHFNWEADVEDALGRVEFGAGRYGEAEARFRRAIAFKEQDNERNRNRTAQGVFSPTQEQVEGRLDGMYSWLALTLAREGRLAEAESNARRAVLSAIGRGGRDGVQVGKMLQNLAQILAEQGRFDEALALLDRARSNFDRAGVAPDSLLLAQNHRLRAGPLAGLRRWSEVLAEYAAASDILGSDRQLADNFATPTIGWVRALLALKRPEEALAKARLLQDVLSQRQGPDSYETAEAQAYGGVILVELRRDTEAIPILHQALARMVPLVAQQNDRSGLRFARLTYIVTHYLRALARVRGTPGEAALGFDAADEAFVAADVLRGQAVQQAMIASSVRAAAGNPALADLVRREQDSRQERDALYTILADLLSRPADQVLPQTIARMRQRAAELDAGARQAMQEIRAGFPGYADLIAPRPADIATIQARLRPGEALLSILPTEDQTLLWAIPASGPSSFAVAPLGQAAIDDLVRRLRLALDPGDVDLRRLPGFDAAAAHSLFTQLLAPVAAGWQGAQHLFVAAGGDLARLPFAVLLTEPVATAEAPSGLPFAQYRNWPWLIRSMGISQLPAATSLLTLRRMARGAPDRSAFIGFGDPDFSGAGPAPAVAATRRLRATGRFAGNRNGDIDYGSIAPLPDTRAEIVALATALHADPKQDVFLGRAASRDAVLGTDLSRRRIVAFATHGLLAGEYPGVDQPALALANPGNGRHGLLSLDDILTLKLDADWVILSACNTAAGDGRGGEAISGLGRGFFYSGSRALLVTHWPVETVSARNLVVGVFAELAAAPQIPRAEALRRAMLKVMGDDGRDGNNRFAYAHPLFWAPYALVGDGGN